jgi:glycosyltransferase involved in cell wall biosynthesis
LYSPKSDSSEKSTQWSGGAATKPGMVRHPRGVFSRAFPAVWRTFHIPRDFEKSRLDIYHGLSSELPVDFRRRRMKLVVTVHDLIFLRYPGFYSPIDRQTYYWKSRHACAKADAILAVSQQTKQDITDFLKVPADRIQVIYQACAPVFFEQASAAGKTKVIERYKLPENFILFVGTIEERKNLLTLVKAWERLRDAEINLVMVGKRKSHFNSVASYLRRQGLENRVQFLENVPSEDLPAIYQLARLFVYPSLFEGFGIPIIEALASRVPVISSCGSCFTEAGGPGSRYVEPGDEESLAHEIRMVLSSEPLKKEMIAQGLSYVQRFRPKNIAGQMMEFYQGL